MTRLLLFNHFIEFTLQKRGSAVLLVDKDGHGPTQRTLSDARQQGLMSSVEYQPAFPQVRLTIITYHFKYYD